MMAEGIERILFATPPLSLDARYGRLAEAGSSAPSLGILMLAAAVRREGYVCTVIDASAINIPETDFIARVDACRPQVLGLSATTLSIANAAAVATRLKELHPSVIVIIGGPHASAVPVETLAQFPAFDVAVIGEGEETVVQLLAALNSQGGLDGVCGIAYRDGGEIRTTGRRPYINDLDRLPLPAWDLLEGFPDRYAPAPFKTRRLPAASLTTSRGCPNRCIFCDRSVFGASCHTYSAEYVLETMERLSRDYGVREIAFEDDTFVTFRKRLEEICHGIMRRRLDISWSCLGRVSHVSRELLNLMKRAGCWQVSFGIESGNQEILNAIRKGVTLQQIRAAVAASREAGLRNKGFFIVGHPGETHETLRQTIAFALELPLDDISVSMLTPFPGTELYARASEFGSFDPDWTRMSLLNPVFIPAGLTQDDLVRAQKEMLKKFYFRPRIIAGYLARIAANPAMIGGVGRGFRSLLRSLQS